MRLQSLRPSWTGVTGVLVILLGLVFIGLGGWLILLGGVWYYAIAGIGLVATGALVAARRREALWIYGLTFATTLVWALTEVGLDGWQLVPRLIAPAVLGIWLSLPWIAGRLDGGRDLGGRDMGGRDKEGPPRPIGRWASAAGYALVVVLVVAAGYRVTATRYLQAGEAETVAAVPEPAPAVAAGDWRYYGRTAEGRRFSPLDQITPENVAGLEPAWQFRSGDLPKAFETRNGREFNFEATPIKVGDGLYFCTPHRQVIALDPETGQERWRFDPEADTSANEYLACRGVAYYEAPAGTPCRRRIVTTTADARMVALDAETGRPCAGFGEGGFVSLTDRLGEVPPGFHFITSQPMVLRDRIVLGGWVYDNQAQGEPSGVIRAYDATTGAPAWAWDLGRPDPTAPLEPGESFTRGTPNGWGSYTADARLGLVYVPLGNATPDYWGGERRPFDETYSSALVALDIETGKERWHFQTVHHDVWDFDLPIGPSLVDLPTANGTVPALIQSTKMGEFFVLDRRTGEPLTGVEEMPVPGDGLPGDTLSATQPVSSGMPSLAPPDLKAIDMWGATPIDQLLCRIDFRRLRYDGRFTPPTLGGDISYPAFDGVVDWQGATIDPIRQVLIANASYIPFTVRPMPQDQAIAEGLMEPWAGWDSGQPYPKPAAFAVGPQYGTPYAAVVKPWLGLFQAPCHAPPWGKLVAIDLRSRQILWQRPLGTTRDTGPFGTHVNLPLPTGVFNIGGNTATASGLIFIGATTDQYLRAFDERTGEKLWEARLPAGGQATPMTYMGDDGRQYVVIAAGGHGGLRTRLGDYLVAYALPDAGRSG